MGFQDDFKPSFEQDNIINIEPHEVEDFINSNLWKNIEQWLNDRKDIFTRSMLDSKDIYETKTLQGMVLEDEMLLSFPALLLEDIEIMKEDLRKQRELEKLETKK